MSDRDVNDPLATLDAIEKVRLVESAFKAEAQANRELEREQAAIREALDCYDGGQWGPEKTLRFIRAVVG